MATIEIVYCTALIPHVEYVTHVGSRTHSYTKAVALALLDAGNILYTSAGDGNIAVILPVKRNGTRHLQTHRDGTETNNLLSLPPCPSWLPLAA